MEANEFACLVEMIGRGRALTIPAWMKDGGMDDAERIGMNSQQQQQTQQTSVSEQDRAKTRLMNNRQNQSLPDKNLNGSTGIGSSTSERARDVQGSIPSNIKEKDKNCAGADDIKDDDRFRIGETVKVTTILGEVCWKEWDGTVIDVHLQTCDCAYMCVYLNADIILS